MKILILGGTGAMGKALVTELSHNKDNSVYVTSRSPRESFDNVTYIQGNAQEDPFLETLLKSHYDAIIDFMIYPTEKFKNRYQSFLKATEQYIFLSSARVYAPSDDHITENSPRLLDVCTDREYLQTDEYALAKAREEDILSRSAYHNYTIVRPGLTYNDNRFQLAIWEKEEWLYRALRGQKIVFPKALEDIIATHNYGGDVSGAIARLIGNPKAFGETVHIAGAKPETWGRILSIYQEAIEKKTGRKINVYYADDLDELSVHFNRIYQTRYARGISRQYDNSKLESMIGRLDFVTPQEGLTKCMNSFLDNAQIPDTLDWIFEAYLDRLSGDIQSLSGFPGKKNKLRYLAARFTDHYWK